MIEKIKGYLNYILGLALLIVSVLLFRKRMQNETLESELRREKTNDEIKENDRDRADAKTHADALVKAYEFLKNKDDKTR